MQLSVDDFFFIIVANSGVERTVLRKHARRAERGLLVLPAVAEGRAPRSVVQSVLVVSSEQLEVDRPRVRQRLAHRQH